MSEGGEGKRLTYHGKFVFLASRLNARGL